MDKNQFIIELRKNLKGLEEKDIRDIVYDYEEHINSGIARGKSEEEVIGKLGNPEDIAQTYLIEFLKTQSVPGENGSRIRKTENGINIDRDVPMDGIDRINISISSCNLQVKPGNRETLHANLSGNRRNNDYYLDIAVNISGSTLNLGIEYEKRYFFSFDNLQLTISVPDSFKGDIISNSASGNMEFSDLVLDKAEFHSSSGNIRLSEINSSGLTASTSSGDLECNRLKSEFLLIHSNSGKVRLNNLEGNDIKISSTSGSLSGKEIHYESGIFQSASGGIQLEEISGNSKFKNSSGNIFAGYSKFDYNIEMRSSSGSLTLELPETSKFNLNTKTASGNIYTSFPLTVSGKISKNNLNGQVGESQNMIDLHTSSGNIAVQS